MTDLSDIADLKSRRSNVSDSHAGRSSIDSQATFSSANTDSEIRLEPQQSSRGWLDAIRASGQQAQIGPDKPCEAGEWVPERSRRRWRLRSKRTQLLHAEQVQAHCTQPVLETEQDINFDLRAFIYGAKKAART